MFINEIMYFIENNFWAQQFFCIATPIIVETSFNRFLKRFHKKDLSWQLLHCLQEAHRQTCDSLQWEYDPDTYFCISKELLTPKNTILNEALLTNVFSKIVGNEIRKQEIDQWLYFFEKELASDEHSNLREYLKIKFLLKESSLSDIQLQYIERFEKVVFSNSSTNFLQYQFYIPNCYYLKDEQNTYDNLLDLIESFICDSFTEWAQNNKYVLDQNVNTLFIFGSQCTGKSTLVSKIIYDNYSSYEESTRRVYVVNFCNRCFRSTNLSPDEICKYLSLKTNCLKNAVLIIDGLDESEWSSAEASDRLEYLINDLKEYNCKLIVTSRPNYFFSIDFKNTLDIYLCPFSIKQAEFWLELYKQVYKDLESEKIIKHITELQPDIRNVILIPYVFQICIINNIQFNHITGIASLYDKLFSSNDGKLLTTPYNIKSRNILNTIRKNEKAIIDISKHALADSQSLIPCSFISDIENQYSLVPNILSSEYLLYRKDCNNYAFIHNSIPYYFIAKHLSVLFINSVSDNSFERLLSELIFFCENEIQISSSLFDYLVFFARSYSNKDYSHFIIFLKLFLCNHFNNLLVFNADIISIQKYYYLIFVNILKLVFAFCSQNFKLTKPIKFFELLDDIEKEQLILYTNYGNSSLDFLNICSFININLDKINFQSINLRGRIIRNTSIKQANFKSANLSGAYIINSDFSLCCFDNSNCKNIDFTNSILFGCSFKNARLNGTNFTNAILDYCDFRGAHLSKCNFTGASLKETKILAEQLRYIFDFDIDYIRNNQIRVYLDDCLIPDKVLEVEYQKQRPVSYLFYCNNKDKFSTNTNKQDI